MGIITWLWDRMQGKSTKIPAGQFFDYAAEYAVRELAFWAAVNAIANGISKCEFKTYIRGVEVKKDEWYLWNVEPNKNQNSSAFIRQWVTTLFQKNECLIVQTDDGQLVIADSFQHKEYAVYEDVFTQVTVRDYVFQRAFAQNEVLYYKLNSADVNRLLQQLYESYGKLIAYGQKYYQKSRGSKGTLKVPAPQTGNTEQEESVNAYLANQCRSFLENDNGVLPLYEGYEYTNIGSKTYANDSTRDIRAMIDDVFDFTARAFGIPPALLRGDIAGTKDAMESFLTLCLDPLADFFAEEIVRKRCGKAAVLEGTTLVIDTMAVKHIDLLSVAGSIDKLIGSGAFCINDIRKLVGKEPIDEPWAWQHWITKNYATVEELLEMLQNGEGKEELKKMIGGGGNAARDT